MHTCAHILYTTSALVRLNRHLHLATNPINAAAEASEPVLAGLCIQHEINGVWLVRRLIGEKRESLKRLLLLKLKVESLPRAIRDVITNKIIRIMEMKGTDDFARRPEACNTISTVHTLHALLLDTRTKPSQNNKNKTTRFKSKGAKHVKILKQNGLVETCHQPL